MSLRNLTAVAAIVAGAIALGRPAVAMAGPFEDGLRAHAAGDFAAAIDKWRPLAEAGDVRAQFTLGTVYDLGHGVARDFARAAKWFGRAAEQGHGDAQYNLAAMYRLGLGVARDPVRALTWFVIAGRAGHELAREDERRLRRVLSPSQIETAEQRAADWQARHPRP